MIRSSTASVLGLIPFCVGVVVVSALFAVLPAWADLRIVSSPGGAVDAYLEVFAHDPFGNINVPLSSHDGLVGPNGAGLY